jgi:hypothetical protein
MYIHRSQAFLLLICKRWLKYGAIDTVLGKFGQ